MNKYLEQLVALSQIDQEIDSFEPKIQAISKPLKDTKHKIAKLSEQLDEYENEIKELQAQQVGANTHISEFSAKIAEIAKKVASVKTEREANALETLSVEINAKVAELEKERGLVDERKSKLTAQMNQKILSFYQKIRKWAKNTAVVPVRKQACYGCFMKIYDKTYLAILKSEEIVTCPHCGRILYKEPETAGKNAEKSAKKESTQEL